MEITKTKTDTTILFKNIKTGDMFVSGDRVYIRIHTTCNGDNAVCLDDGNMIFMRMDSFVHPVKSVEVEF